MKASFAIALVLGWTVLPTFATAQTLFPITSCVEVSVADIGTSARRRGTEADCPADDALSRATRESRVNARDALGPTCASRTSAAMEQRTCAAVGLSRPTTQGTSLQGPPVAAPGRPAVDFQLPVQTSNRKLCVVLRDLSNETETVTRPAAFCLLEGFRETVVTFRSRARCGVQCLSQN